jgi:ATP-dependent Clp protease ATP-binding subunit ClpA
VTLPQSNADSPIFRRSGALRLDRFSESARDLLDACTAWLTEVQRAIYLPIDLLVVMVDRGDETVSAALSAVSRGTASELAEGLRSLARRVDRRGEGLPRLEATNLSLGFSAILSDAWEWAEQAGRERADVPDIARAIRWRIEMQDSASIRWIVRQLGQPGTDTIFDDDGNLRRAAFSTDSWNALRRSATASARSGLSFVGTPHFIAALTQIRDGVLARAATRAGISPRRVHDELSRIVGPRQLPGPDFTLGRRTLTPRLVQVLAAAWDSAEARGGPIEESEILAAFLEDGGSSLDVLRALGLLEIIEEIIAQPADQRPPAVPVGVDLEGPPQGVSGGATPTLDTIGRDLTADARTGKLPEVLGREIELQRVINVLLRTEQRNPLLTGEAGVGKTALAVALAQRIASGTVPKRLADMRVIEINGASLLGGTSYRGELEARIRALLAEAEQNVILFIDEAHAVFAPRSSTGQPAEVPNHFKAALASGQLAVIAATTEAEYHRWIEQDPALRRRFERIEVPELTPAFTRDILARLAPVYEKTWEVPVTPDAVDAAVEFSVRYVPEQSLPDKAKKLLMDSTIAVASELAAQSKPAHDPGAAGTPSKRVVTRHDVAHLVSQKTGIPMERIVRGAVGWWVGIDERLAARAPGQAEAVEQISRALVTSRIQAVGQRRPQGVFLFAGPPGVGKGRLAEAMADEIFGSPKALIRIDMSDFGEPHSMSRLVGSPPGYVGYQDEDMLVTPIRRRPSSIVLLRDFDLAHPQVQERVLRIFEEGEIADTRGMRADASHAIFILTVAMDSVARPSIGFGANGADSPLARLSPELAERIKGYAVTTVMFRGLNVDGGNLAVELVDDRLASLRLSVRDEYGLDLVVSDALRRKIVDRVRESRDAREIEAAVRDLVIERLTRRLLDGVDGEKLTIDLPRERERV